MVKKVVLWRSSRIIITELILAGMDFSAKFRYGL